MKDCHCTSMMRCQRFLKPVMENFMNSLSDIRPRVNGLELLKYTCYDWRTVFCSNERRLLKQETLKQL